MPQKTLAVIFGGRSGEHVVSLRSAESIMKAVDRERYRVIQVGLPEELDYRRLRMAGAER